MSQGKKEFKPVESGEYVGILKEAALEKMKNGNGKRISMRFEIEVGDEKKLVFHDLTSSHKTSKKAVEIGRKGADLFLKAVGVEDGLEGVGDDMTAVMDYIDTPLIIYVGQEKPREYVDKEGQTRMSKARNKVLTFKAR
jgi:hypothetical protein